MRASKKLPRSEELTSDGLNQAQLEAYTVYTVSVSPTTIYSDSKFRVSMRNRDLDVKASAEEPGDGEWPTVT